MRGRDGYDFYGNRLRVELAKGSMGRGRGGGGGGGGFGGAPPPGFRPRQTGFRILVKGLPMSASWQDVKVRRCVVRAGERQPVAAWSFATHTPSAAKAQRSCPERPCP